jgi:hypothetical protein
MVKRETQAQQQTTLQYTRRHCRITNRTQQNGVMLTQSRQFGIGQSFAIAVPAGGTQGELGSDQLVWAVCQHGLQNLERFSHHFRANTVAANHGQFDCVAHQKSLAVVSTGPISAANTLLADQWLTRC